MTPYKWPRTYHHPSSPSLQNDDRRLPDARGFHHPDGTPRICVYTSKLDGEGATMTREVTYPRSPDGRYHPSRDIMKRYHAKRAADIPEGWRISGEYMRALHSVPYTRANGNPLASWFHGFGVWNTDNVLLPWDETLEVFEMLDVLPVPVLHIGPWDEVTIARLAREVDPVRDEGFVVRVADAIPYPDGTGDAGRFFGVGGRPGVCKWVRHGHVVSEQHWASGAYQVNELAEGVDGL